MEMGLKNAKGLIFILTASMLAVSSMANKNFTWNNGFNYTDWLGKHRNDAGSSNRIIVGGSANWQFGFNYIDWSFKNGPFYLNDTLVFKYGLPADNFSHPHSVYLLPNYRSFVNCDVSGGKQLADGNQGGGEGFEFRLTKWQPYYFACGAGNGFHCNNGTMKFFVMPLFRRWHG